MTDRHPAAQGGSPSGVDAADKANSELLLNFANSAATEQAHAASAPATATAAPAAMPVHAAPPATDAAAAVAALDGAADQRRAAADMLAQRLLDTIAAQSPPGSALPSEEAMMQSLQHLANKCMQQHVAPREPELRAALERCLQCVRSAATSSAALVRLPSADLLQRRAACRVPTIISIRISA